MNAANTDPVLEIAPLGFPWVTIDPFLFCAYHDDAYPKGNAAMAPDPKLLAGRRMGMDFEKKDGFRMYHGSTVPGFPQHPHRGFETVTIVRKGFIDHSDSLGATARFGQGDVQWITAGEGIVHCEMFPLLEEDKDNPLELFQIWLNLPRANKLVKPHFSMLWSEHIPHVTFVDGAGKKAEVAIIAGELDGKRPPPPPPHSWAANAESDVALWTIALEPGATWTIPRAKGEETVRTLFFFRGKSVRVGTQDIAGAHAIVVRSDADVRIEAIDGAVELLLMQGRPIDEPVVQHGPFVMNTKEEIERAFTDYRKTQFGGWPWPSDDPVHPRTETRFAKLIDGRLERP